MLAKLIDHAKESHPKIHKEVVEIVDWIRKNRSEQYLDPIELLKKKVFDRNRCTEFAVAVALLESDGFLSEKFTFKGKSGKFIEGISGTLTWDSLAEMPKEIELADGEILERDSQPVCVIFEIKHALLGDEESPRKESGR